MREKNKDIIAFCLFKYFPYGGLERDFMRIAGICSGSGFGIRVYTMSWEGEIPAGFDVRIIAVSGLSNHTKARKFSAAVAKELANEPADLVVGFNKMAALDVYYAADTCFAEKCSKKSIFYRLAPRARTYLHLESMVLGGDSKTEVLLISKDQKTAFQSFYKISDERMTLLPLGADKKFFDSKGSSKNRRAIREELKINEADWMLLQVGSAFERKGIDRSIEALAALPEHIRKRTVYVVVGGCKNPKPFRKLAQKHGVSDRVIFTGVRMDVKHLMQAADMLVHPARSEAAGMVLVESLAVGLPVLCSGICGYASVVKDCCAGRVLNEPFDQSQLNIALAEMLNVDTLRDFSDNARVHGTKEKLSGLPEKVAEIIMKRAYDSIK